MSIERCARKAPRKASLAKCKPGLNCMNSCVTRRPKRSDNSDRSARPGEAPRRFATFLHASFVAVFLLIGLTEQAQAATARQTSLDEWRNLTSPANNAPRAFVRSDHIRFYFQVGTNYFEFNGDWSRHRIPSSGYRVDSALLHWKQRVSRIPDGGRSWREATVIAGNDWRQLATNLFRELVPQVPGHGVYFQAFLADRLLYRDQDGSPRVA